MSAAVVTTPATEVVDASTKARIAAYQSVAAWVDLEAGRALVGCTPSMVAQVAVDAFMSAGGEEAEIVTLRSALEDAMYNLRVSNENAAALARSQQAHYSEYQNAREDADEFRVDRDEARTRQQELEAELNEVRTANAALAAERDNWRARAEASRG